MNQPTKLTELSERFEEWKASANENVLTTKDLMLHLHNHYEDLEQRISRLECSPSSLHTDGIDLSDAISILIKIYHDTMNEYTRESIMNAVLILYTTQNATKGTK